MKLRSKIILIFGGAIAACLFAVGTFSLSNSYSMAVKNVTRDMATTSTLAADQIASSIYHYECMATAAGTDELIAGDTSAETKSQRISELAQYYGFTSGNVLNASGISYGDGTDFSDREYFKKALAGETNISDITLSKYTGKYGFSVAAPVTNPQGAIVGVCYFRMDIDFMENVISQLKTSENGYAFIVDASGNVLVHENEELIQNCNIAELSGGLDAIAGEIANGKSGSASYTYEGQEMLSGYNIIGLTNGWAVLVVAPTSDFSAQIYSSMKALLVIDLIVLILAIIFAVIIANYLSKDIIKVRNSLLVIRDGDLSTKLETTSRKDEIGDLQNAAAKLQDTFTKIIGQANTILSGMSNYNLNQPDMDEYPGEYNTLSVSVNSIKRILKNLIKEVQNSASSVGTGSGQLAQAAEALSEGTTAQAGSIQQMVAEIEEMTSKINSNSTNEQVVSEKLRNLGLLIKEGNAQMNELLNVVSEVEEMSADIQKIVATIDSIAFQTNILALNASVEAARAGENGKGFAVVADEVGNLASKSSEASKQTAELIDKCIQGIEKATDHAKSTFDCLGSIVTDSQEISEAFEEISKDTLEQAEKSNNIEREITTISDVVQTNTATAEETAAATTELSDQANNLSRLIQRFSV